MRSDAPATAAAAPAGIRPTSSQPTTSAPRSSASRGDPRDDLVQRRCLPVLDVHRDLDEPSAWQLDAQRANAGEATTALAHDRGDVPRDLEWAAKVDVERDQRRARTGDHAAGGLVQPRRPEVRRELTGVKAALQCLGPAPPVERRPAFGRRIEEDRNVELRGGKTGEPLRNCAGAREVVGTERDDRHDVGDADARVGSFVSSQVDALDGDANTGEQRLDERIVVTDEREHGPVVILVSVHVEQPSERAEGVADRVDRCPVAALAEVRHRLERQHEPYSRER